MSVKSRILNTGATGLIADSPQRLRSLQDFEDAINRTISLAVSDTNCDDAVDPTIFWSRRLEQRIDAEIIATRIDHLALFYPIQNIGRAMTHALICHRDQCFVPGAEHESNVQGGRAVAADRLPVASAIQDITG